MNKIGIGVDLGGTTVKIGIFSATGELKEKWEIPTRTEEKGKYILSDIATSINGKLENLAISAENVLGMGIGVPGPAVDGGVIGPCDNLYWGVFNIEEELSKLISGIKIKATNDANAAALGEIWKGGGIGAKNAVLVTLGTGVGGGIVIDGNVINGVTGSAGEFGHIQMSRTETEQCTCGKYGCLEQYASATGIVNYCEKILASVDTESKLRSLEKITAKDIFDGAKDKDVVATEVVEFFCDMLGTALAYVSCTIDPEVFVIGGGVSRAGDLLLEGVKKYYIEHAFHATKDVKFKLAELGNDAGIYGAVKLVL